MSRYGLELRAAEPADADGLAELTARAGRPVSSDVVARRLKALAGAPALALLAVEWGPPSGVAVAHWLSTLEADAPVALLSTLLVGPDERRRGIGRALLKAVSQAARQAGCGELRTIDRDDAPSLLAFCLATGFERAGGWLVRPLRKRS